MIDQDLGDQNQDPRADLCVYTSTCVDNFWGMGHGPYCGYPVVGVHPAGSTTNTFLDWMRWKVDIASIQSKNPD